MDRWHYSATLKSFDISVLQPEMNIPQSVEKGGLLQSKGIVKEIKVNIRICVLKVHMKIHPYAKLDTCISLENYY